jgi:hypothetical protein
MEKRAGEGGYQRSDIEDQETKEDFTAEAGEVPQRTRRRKTQEPALGKRGSGARTVQVVGYQLSVLSKAKRNRRVHPDWAGMRHRPSIDEKRPKSPPSKIEGGAPAG